jgi:ribosomal protein L37AE/L43A
MKKYPTHCPACNSASVKRNPLFGMRCNRCGYEARQTIRKDDMSFKTYGGKKDG